MRCVTHAVIGTKNDPRKKTFPKWNARFDDCSENLPVKGVDGKLIIWHTVSDIMITLISSHVVTG